MSTIHVLTSLFFNRIVFPLLEMLLKQFEPLALECFMLEQLTMLNLLHSNPPKL